MGIATQDPELCARLDIEKCASRLANFLDVCTRELCAYARACGYTDVHDFSAEDIVTTNSEISSYTDIKHA